MKNTPSTQRSRLFRAITIISSGFGSATLALWATSLFQVGAGGFAQANLFGSVTAGLAALAGAGCAHAYFSGSDDTTSAFEAALLSDPVTKLHSRSGMERAIRTFLSDFDQKRAQERAFLISMEVDPLREINDVFGHSAGDAMLRVIAKRLQRLVGEAGPIARINGGEFIVVVRTSHSERELRAAVNALMETVSKPVRIADMHHPMYANCGVVEIHSSNVILEKLLRFANLARASALDAGRGTWAIYHPEMSHLASYRKWIEAEFTAAFDRDEFSLNYQPQVRLRDRRVVGYEALVRWTHTEKGVIPPSEFISIAENCGFIHQLGTWVLRRACIDARKLPPHTTMSVNVSTSQIEDPAFIETVARVLSESGLAPERLELEVTESVLIRDHMHMRKQFAALRELGVSIAIDDFGTGYSNLNYLSELAFEKLKIDKSFIDRIGQHSDVGPMISTIVSLANSINATVVAEGVESENQALILTAAGCQVMQGYLYSKPVPLDVLLESTPTRAPSVQHEMAETDAAAQAPEEAGEMANPGADDRAVNE